MKENFKIIEVYQKIFEERAVRPPGKRGNVTLIHPIRYKPQIFTNEVSQWVFDKFVITCQNIWRKGAIRPQLVESGYCKT